MEIVRLNDMVSVLHGSVNMGLVATQKGLVAVDTGLDKQSGKQLLKAANDLGLAIIAIINTHAHADHFGGNDTVLKGNQIPVYAPVFEADVIRRPNYEPEYLWYGATPPLLLRNKFLEAKPSPVTYEFCPGDKLQIDDVTFQTKGLQGHSLNQAGICVHGVFFAADAYFGKEITDKHGIPYMVDFDQTLISAKAVVTDENDWYIPGHGELLRDVPEKDVFHLVKRHEDLFDYTVSLIRSSPISMENLIERVCTFMQIKLVSLSSYVLIRTPISAYISAAVSRGLIHADISGGSVILSKKEAQL